MKQHLMMAIGLAGIGGFFAVYFQDFSIPYVFDGLAWARQNYMNSPDVNQNLNADLWYPLAVIKLLFSPYLTPSKFNIFVDLSALLTWGGPISQVIMLSAIVGIWAEFRKNLMRTIVVAFPFALFLLLFGYLAPFSGRQRDSFLPAISIFAALGLTAIVRRKKSSKS